MKYDVLSNNLKLYRKKLGLTQKELGEKILKSEISIRKYESGNTNIPPSTLFDICNVLGITSEILLGSDIDSYHIENFGEILENSSFKKDRAYTNLNNQQNSESYYLEQYIYSLGYEFIAEEENGYLILKTKDGEFEIEMKDLEDLHINSRSFIKFKISEIIKKSRKIGN